jgi:hypothetical protein
LAVAGIDGIFVLQTPYPMKRAVGILSVLVLGALFTVQLTAQCAPVPTCVDTLEPGEYCPQSFLPLIVDMAYDEVITFMLALEFEHNGLTYTLDSLAIDSVKNIPPGITYTSSASGYVPGAVQTPAAEHTILALFTLGPVFGGTAAVVVMCFYKLDDAMFEKILEDLEQRKT